MTGHRTNIVASRWFPRPITSTGNVSPPSQRTTRLGYLRLDGNSVSYHVETSRTQTCPTRMEDLAPRGIGHVALNPTTPRPGAGQ